jgi:hypothetical protein
MTDNNGPEGEWDVETADGGSQCNASDNAGQCNREDEQEGDRFSTEEIAAIHSGSGKRTKNKSGDSSHGSHLQ